MHNRSKWSIGPGVGLFAKTSLNLFCSQESSKVKNAWGMGNILKESGDSSVFYSELLYQKALRGWRVLEKGSSRNRAPPQRDADGPQAQGLGTASVHGRVVHIGAA
jgi:hypothetical protein